jgi:hypothetical protein
MFDYDYQYGYCHFFANHILKKIKKLVPKNVPVRYYLILGERLDDDDESIEAVLIHAYIKIKDYYLDSDGFHSIHEVNQREEEWRQREEQLTEEGYSFDTWQTETDEIPEYFFNRFCKVEKVKKDIEEFLLQPKIQEVFTKLKEKNEDKQARSL